MTSKAGNIFMLSIKFEIGLVMIEFRGLPVLKGMTPDTTDCSTRLKLAEMNVGMAIHAILVQRSKLLPGMTCCGTKMAVTTGLMFMSAG